MTRVEEIRHQSFPALRLENEALTVVNIPELGGKIISLCDRASGFDPVFTNPHTGLVRYPYDAPYATSDSGIGELLPTIGPGNYPEAPWNGVPLPDKGELWTQPFETRVEGEALVQHCYGVRFPYRFTRRLSLLSNSVVLEYKLENLCGFNFKYLWSLQPHLVLTADVAIQVEGPARFYVDWSKNHALQAKTRKYGWPEAMTQDGGRVDFSRISEMDGNADKLFLTDLAKGEVRLRYLDRGVALVFSFDNTTIRNCGLWINRCGWPLEGKQTQLIAVQPCNCTSDFFDDSLRQGSGGLVQAHSDNTWKVSIGMIKE
jgi:hypothetical protein